MDTDARLEALSDKVRKGELVSFVEALEVIDYQEQRKQARKLAQSKTLFARIRSFFRPSTGD